MTDKRYQLACDCGALSMVATGEPVVSLYCHCASCRNFYDTVMLAAAPWADERLELPNSGPMYDYQHPHKRMRRLGCAECGTLMLGRNAPGLPIIPHALFAAANGGELPAELAPTLHLFYAQRVLDVDDPLPKSEGGEALGL